MLGNITEAQQKEELDKARAEGAQLQPPMEGVEIVDPSSASLAIKDKTSLRMLKARKEFWDAAQPVYVRMREIIEESGPELNTLTGPGAELDQLQQQLIQFGRGAQGAGAAFTEPEMEILRSVAPVLTGWTAFARSKQTNLDVINRAEEGAFNQINIGLKNSGMQLSKRPELTSDRRASAEDRLLKMEEQSRLLDEKIKKLLGE